MSTINFENMDSAANGRIKETLQALIESNQDLVKSESEANNELRKSKIELDMMKIEFSKLSNHCKSLESSNEKTKRDAEDQALAIAQSDAQIRDLKDYLESAKKKNQKLVSLREESIQKLSEQQQQIQRIESDLSSSKHENQKLLKILMEVEHTVNHSRTLIGELESQRDASQKDVETKNKKILALKSKNKDLQHDNRKLKDMLKGKDNIMSEVSQVYHKHLHEIVSDNNTLRAKLVNHIDEYMKKAEGKDSSLKRQLVSLIHSESQFLHENLVIQRSPRSPFYSSLDDHSRSEEAQEIKRIKIPMTKSQPLSPTPKVDHAFIRSASNGSAGGFENELSESNPAIFTAYGVVEDTPTLQVRAETLHNEASAILQRYGHFESV